MDTLCRVCIKKAAKCTSLNTKIEDSSDRAFFDFLNKCTSINAGESDKLPQGLCSICTHSVKTFYSFVKFAENSNIILRAALKNSTTTGRYNDNKEISCEEMTTASGKIEQELEGFSKEETFHSQISKSSNGSSLYILDLIKEESHVSKSTTIVEFKGDEINESEKLHCNLDHPKGSVVESYDILCMDRRLATEEVVQEGASDAPSVRRSDRLIDNRGISYEEITIRNEKIKEEPEALNKEESLHFQAGKNSPGSSLYILDIVKEEPRVSESTSIVYFKDAEITESEKFHSNLGHPEGSIEEPDDALSCIDGDLASIDTEHSESDDDVPISLLKRRFVNNEDETDFPSTKIKCEEHFIIGHGSRNQVSIEAKDDSLKPLFRENIENSYKCKECDMVFNDKEEFRTLCRNHIYGDKHECNICGRKFARRRYLNKHLVIHDEERKYKCSICVKSFKCSSYLSLHMKVHSGEKPFECEICGKKFVFKNKYNRHLRIHTVPPDKKHGCEICCKKFSSKCKLNNHMKTHKGITKKCDQCHKEFTSSLTLRMHMKWHSNPKCEICGKKFSSKHYLKVHMEKHKGIIKKCDQCNKEFTNSLTLRMHMKWHTNPKCEICGKKFSSKHYLKVHMENHNEITKKCDQCDKECKNSHALRRHMKLHTEKCEKCAICSKTFSTKHCLKRHMECHNVIKKKCDQCDKELKNKNTLWRHMKRHNEPKCAKCEICGKKFGSKYNLKIHMENHNGITKKCVQCDKELKNSDTLRIHMRWHNNPKPFKCEKCGKFLARKNSYTKHIEICKPVGRACKSQLEAKVR